MLKKYSAYPFLFWTSLFVILPLFIIVYYSVTTTESGNIILSAANFKRFINPIFINVTKKSIFIALQATTICLIIGYPLSYFMTRVSSRTEKLLVMLLVLPMWMNFLLRTYAWQSLLGKSGFINTIITSLGFPQQELMFTKNAVLLVMVYNFLPFMVLPIYTVIKKINKGIIEAAEDLGANKYVVFKKIILPLSIPGIVSGITMTFLPAVSSFVIPDLIGGNKYPMIGNIIEKQFLLLTDWHFGSALSMILLFMILVSIVLTSRFEHDEEVDHLW